MIDTAEKRRSVAGLVTPEIAKDAEWRIEAAGWYSGLSVMPPDIPPIVTCLHIDDYPAFDLTIMDEPAYELVTSDITC